LITISRFLGVVAVLLFPALTRAQDLASNGAGIWSIGDAPGMSRWIVIHDPGTPKADGVYHIEVIGRKAGGPAWQVVRLAPHMAITEPYAAWRAENDGAGGGVCTKTVIECMRDGGSDEK